MLNILVVDDSKMARVRISQMIKSFELEHTIKEANDGIIALEILESGDINVVVTDLEMPNMDGLELVDRIRKKSKDLDIIVITTVVNEQIKQLLKSERCTYFMKKPIDKKVFNDYILKIKNHISHKDM